LDESYSVRAGLTTAARVSAFRQSHPGIREFAEIGDLSLDYDRSEALRDVDVLIHLAARVHVMNDRGADPLSVFRQINVHGSEKLALQAARQGVRRMIFVSSIKVNGEETTEKPFSEEDSVAPSDPYGISKWEAEEALRAIGAQTGMEVTIIRPPLVYGPGVRANFLRLIKMAHRGLPLPLSRTRNRRSFVCVENIADFLVCCADHPGAANQTFLLSDGQDLSTRELIEHLACYCGKKARFLPVPEGILRLAAQLVGKEAELSRLVGSLQVNSNKARKCLGWTPPVTLEEGLRSTVNWYVNSLK
jgi:nucleoside-diphosphate-sugar epimerase